jgi:hypothetical protein
MPRHLFSMYWEHVKKYHIAVEINDPHIAIVYHLEFDQVIAMKWNFFKLNHRYDLVEFDMLYIFYIKP